MASERQHELDLLEALEAEPETSQADLAVQVGVAVGTVNWYLKRWATKGYVKIRRIGRWRWRYLLTPEGIVEKTRLAGEYIEASLALYRRTRAEAKRLLSKLKASGYTEVGLDGTGDVAEIAKLTCLELGLRVVHDLKGNRSPVLQVKGTQLKLIWNAQDSEKKEISSDNST